jgi:uncharacterized protein (TIGR00645 family)
VSDKSQFERGFERSLFAARWLLAPIYLGLVGSLAMLLVVFVRELAGFATQVFTMEDEDVILATLTLIDLSLAGNLVLIVLFSGYENFVSQFDLDDQRDRPSWLGTVDFGGLKLKLIASIVAISGIHLLKWFMELGEYASGEPIDEPQLRWLVIIHVTFVVSGVLLALMDWLSARTRAH